MQYNLYFILLIINNFQSANNKKSHQVTISEVSENYQNFKFKKMYFGSFNVRVYEAAQCSPYIIITVQLTAHQFFYDLYSAVHSKTEQLFYR